MIIPKNYINRDVTIDETFYSFKYSRYLILILTSIFLFTTSIVLAHNPICSERINMQEEVHQLTSDPILNKQDLDIFVQALKDECENVLDDYLGLDDVNQIKANIITTFNKRGSMEGEKASHIIDMFLYDVKANTTDLEEGQYIILKMTSVFNNILNTVELNNEGNESPQVNGQNVTYVYTNADLEFCLIGEKIWVEMKDRTKPSFYFKETSRDEWSVYLEQYDWSNKKVALDLHRSKVLVNGDDIYTIESIGKDEMNPQMVKSIAEINDGTNPLSSSINKALIAGTGISVSEVSNHSASNNTAVKKKRIEAKDASNIIFAEIGTNNSVGEFKLTSEKSWKLLLGENSKASYKQTGIDQWSVYLKDSSSGENVRIDLWTKEILFNELVRYSVIDAQ